MLIRDAAEWFHRTAVTLFGLHATNPQARLLGLPGAGTGNVNAANTILTFLDQVESERRARAAVRRCRAARRPLRAVRPPIRKRQPPVRRTPRVA